VEKYFLLTFHVKEQDMSIYSINQNYGSGIHLMFSPLWQAMYAIRINILVVMAAVFLLLSVMSIITQGSLSYAQATDTIHTAEYYSNTTDDDQRKNFGGNLGYINADVAYALGFFGNNVRIGVIDSTSFEEHQEFQKKNNTETEIFPGYTPTGENYTHGIKVAGIIAAAKDEVQMHGVAYGADIFAEAPQMFYFLNNFTEKIDIKIINMSFAEGYTNLADHQLELDPPS
jgi:hypothetical protein